MNNERFVKFHMLDNQVAVASPGEVLEISTSTYLGIVAYDPGERKAYGAELSGGEESIDWFVNRIPARSLSRLKFLLFGYIPMPRTAFKTGMIPPEYQEMHVDLFYSRLEKSLVYIKEKYGLKIQDFVFRDSVQHPEFRDLWRMKVLMVADTGEVFLYGQGSKDSSPEEIERINLL